MQVRKPLTFSFYYKPFPKPCQYKGRNNIAISWQCLEIVPTLISYAREGIFRTKHMQRQRASNKIKSLANQARLFKIELRQRPTLPEGPPSSTIGAEGLNFCVRYGHRCFPFAIVTGIFPIFLFSKVLHAPSKPHNAELLRSSPRPISIRQLSALLHLHPGPIYLVFFEGPYSAYRMGNLILRGASRLDAFSVYPFRT